MKERRLPPSLGVFSPMNNGSQQRQPGRAANALNYLEQTASIREGLLGIHPASASTILNYCTCLRCLVRQRRLCHVAWICDCLGMGDTELGKAVRPNSAICLKALDIQYMAVCDCM